MTSAKDVAKLFVELGTIQAESESGDGMTNLRLNKLLYFAQGYCLAEYDHPLFMDKIEAWDFGPVVPSVYHQYKGFKKNVIEDSAADRGRFSDAEFNLILDIYRTMKQFSTAKLVDMSHETGSPWYDVYHNVSKGGEIDRELIKTYFISHPICSRPFSDAVEKLKKRAYTPERDENGVAIMQKELTDGWCD